MTRKVTGVETRAAVSASIPFALLVTFLAVAASSTSAHADPIRLTDTLRLSLSTMGTGVGDATKYKDAQLDAATKQANDYAMKYSKDYTAFAKYEIYYTVIDGKPTLDISMSTIKFSMPTFSTLPIKLTNVTGDFEKNMFTRFEFEAVKWYPDLEEKYRIKNDAFKGFIDLSDAKKPAVDITASYIWLETFDGAKLIQPAATLTYKTTAKDNPGLGDWDPTPPGPAAVPEPSSLLLMPSPLAGLLFWRSRTKTLLASSARNGFST
jgi:hypothetical protein